MAEKAKDAGREFDDRLRDRSKDPKIETGTISLAIASELQTFLYVGINHDQEMRKHLWLIALSLSDEIFS